MSLRYVTNYSNRVAMYRVLGFWKIFRKPHGLQFDVMAKELAYRAVVKFTSGWEEVLCFFNVS